jgi:hypothetical protein
MLQVRMTASLAKTSGDIREGFQPGMEIGVDPARNSVQSQKGFAQEEKAEWHWMALQSQLLHDLERGVQMDRQCPEAAQSGWTYDYSRAVASGPLAMARRR